MVNRGYHSRGSRPGGVPRGEEMPLISNSDLRAACVKNDIVWNGNAIDAGSRLPGNHSWIRRCAGRGQMGDMGLSDDHLNEAR
jgi:hypothetical protein